MWEPIIAGWSCAAADILINDTSVNSSTEIQAWGYGVVTSEAVVNESVAQILSTYTLRDDAYAYVLDLQSLIAILRMGGNKMLKVKRRQVLRGSQPR